MNTKTETIRGVKVVRVQDLDGSCHIRNADRTQRIKCAFYNDGNCPFQECKSAMFIRPDQIVDYVAIKLVS